MEDNRKEMIPLSENDLEEVSGGMLDTRNVEVASEYRTTLAEKDENSKAMQVNGFHFDCGN